MAACVPPNGAYAAAIAVACKGKTMSIVKVIVFGVAVSTGSVAQAQSPASTGRADILEQLTACRAIPTPTERLSCFDRETARLDEAERQGDVVVVDRDGLRQAGRAVFGLTIPGLTILNRGQSPETVDRLETTIKSANRGADGKWLFVLMDESVWRQIDNANLNYARPGSAVLVRRGAVGSFFLSVDGARSLRVRRQQ